MNMSCFAQLSGTITIQKKDTNATSTDTIDVADTDTIPSDIKPKRKVYLSGLYYSDWVSDEVRTGNNVEFLQTRYFFYYTNRGDVYFFRSSGKPKKLIKAFEKNPNKYAEEVGHYEVDDGYLYIETGGLGSNKIYRYTGEANNKKMWLGMKSEYRKKTRLDLYLTKYVE